MVQEGTPARAAAGNRHNARQARAPTTLSLTLTGRNLATWTKYRGADPEISQSGQFNFSVADFLSQPPVRYFLARVNVTF